MKLHKDNFTHKVNLLEKLKQFHLHLYMLICIIFIANPIFADVVITNTATANFAINGNSHQVSHSVQFTKNVVVIPPDILNLSKSASTNNAEVSDQITYTLSIENPNSTALNHLRIQDFLPEGVSYLADTAKLNGIALPSNQVSYIGDQLNLTLNNQIPAHTSWVVKYQVTMNSTGEFINRAIAISDSASSEVAKVRVTVSKKERTPSTIKFFKISNSGVNSIIPPTSYNNNKSGGKSWQEINEIKLPNGQTITLPTPQPIVSADQYSLLDPIVIEVTDIDQNLNAEELESIVVTVQVPGTNDTEVLLLRETSKNSGVFRGILLSVAEDPSNTNRVQDGLLSLKTDAQISVTYHDEEDISDTSAVAAIIAPKPKLLLAKVADKSSTSLGEQVRYTLDFKNTTNFQINNLVLKDALPYGFKLIATSVKLNGLPLDPAKNQSLSITGKMATFQLGSIPSNAQWSIEYLTNVSTGALAGKATNFARITALNYESNVAKASVMVKDDLLRAHNILTGRVYIGCETNKNTRILKGARIYLETGRSILSDKNGLWHMEGVDPGSHVLQLDTDSLPIGYKPLNCRNNTRHAGDAKSQFVNLQAGTLWQVDFHVEEDKDIQKDLNGIAKEKQEGQNPVTLFNNTYLESTNKGFDILWPKNNYVPTIASTKIFIKASPQQRVDVFLNGKKVSPLNYDGSNTNKAGTVTIRRWFGVDIDIKRNNNTLLAIARDKSGKEVSRKTRNIHFSGEPASAEFLKEQSILVADGKTKPIIALRIKDTDGYPMRANTHGYFNFIGGQYQLNTEEEDEDKEEDINEASAGSYKYKIKENGIAHIILNPTTKSGELKLKLQFANKEQIVSTWLKPNLRDWILVGIAEGTVAHNTLSGNIQALKDQGKADEVYKRGRLAFFAKGKVKGKYLLTIAYDSHKQKRENSSALEAPLNNINPDAWYTIYGDKSQSQYGAPSSKKLYIKIEKSNFYAVFGDFETSMTVTELAKYTRVLTGLKSSYVSENMSLNAFISETSNKHHHEEIPGDGTSGQYHLSHDVIVNSESIKIETRDRYNLEKVLTSRTLIRYQDYEIDYDNNSLFFKFPISGRDENFNPNLIVIDYDSETNSKDAIVAGGRVAVKATDKISVGLSAIHVNKYDTGVKNDSLVAFDMDYQLSSSIKMHAEFALSNSSEGNYKNKKAQIIEIEKQIADIDARLYYRKQEDGFGLGSEGSSSSIESGTKKIGGELNYKITSKTRINTEIYQQENLTNSNKKQVAKAGIQHHDGQFDGELGVRHSKEELSGKTIDNDVVHIGGKYRTKNGKVTLRGSIEKSFENNNGSELSPERAKVGVDLNLGHGLSLFAEHEFTNNEEVSTQNNRVGISKSLWKGAKAKTTYTQETSTQGKKDYVTLGLQQSIKVTDTIRADISVDHAKTLNGTQKQFNANEPLISGSQRDDYTAFSVGLGESHEGLSWTSRLELREGDLEDKMNFKLGIIRYLEDGKQFSGKVSYLRSEESNGNSKQITKLSFGSAWHPSYKNFVVFSRLDLIDEQSNVLSAGALADTHTQKVIHNIHYNQKIGNKTQISLHHGIKHIVDRNMQSQHHSTIDTGMVEIRRDITEKWDIGVRGGYLHDWEEKTTETVAGVSIGMTPMENAWLELGYNFEGFDDKDFDNDNYKRKGVFLTFSYKFNQDSFNNNNFPLGRKKKNKPVLRKMNNNKVKKQAP